MFGKYAFVILFGVVFLILLIEVVEALLALVWRFVSGDRAPAELLYGGFSLRRPDSELRARHHHPIRTTGRTCEAIRYQDDPYDVV